MRLGDDGYGILLVGELFLSMHPVLDVWPSPRERLLQLTGYCIYQCHWDDVDIRQRT